MTALGDPAEKIAEFTRDNAVDLVMLPDARPRPVPRAAAGLGVHPRFCTTSIARCGPRRTPKSSTRQEAPRKILCALDGSEKSLALAQWAADFSRQVGASLQLLHVVRNHQRLAGAGKRAGRCRRSCGRSRGTASRRSLKSVGLDLPLRVAVGEIVATITEEARQEGADLIVLGRGAMHETLGRLRTHAHGIIQRSPCPVLSV